MSVTLTSFVTVDFPGSNATALLGIDNAGDAVGLYLVSGTQHGLLRRSGGGITTIDFPGSSGSQAQGINSLSQPVIVGSYTSGTGPHHFLFSAGAFTSFDVPGDAPGTTPDARLAINDPGQIVGGYLDASAVSHGFLRAVNGTITTIDVPGASGTKAFGINNAGQIVGSHIDSLGTHGFIRETTGSFTTFDVPGVNFTEPHAINNVGEIVGGFFDGTRRHGFFRDAAGAVSTIDVPALGSTITDILGVNDSRGIAGNYFDATGINHGFVGTLTPSVFWGVDSLTPANQKIKALVGNQVVTGFLYDIVTTKAGRAPTFWGRYIGKNGNLTPDEISFLHDPTRNCRILLIFRDTISSTLQTSKQGVDHAKTAIKSAQDLGVPAGVWIYADTEFPAQSPRAEWFQGWFKSVQDPTISPYGAGVYGNTSSGAAPQFDTPFCVAYPSFTQPTKAYVYTNQLNKPCPTDLSATPPSFSNAIVPQPCNPPTVIYQYSINCDVSKAGDQNGIVDLDLASPAGFASMWAR